MAKEILCIKNRIEFEKIREKKQRQNKSRNQSKMYIEQTFKQNNFFLFNFHFSLLINYNYSFVAVIANEESCYCFFFYIYSSGKRSKRHLVANGRRQQFKLVRALLELARVFYEEDASHYLLVLSSHNFCSSQPCGGMETFLEGKMVS